MLGVTKYAPGEGCVGLREWPEPAPGPHDVIVAVKAAGICGTDLHIQDDRYRYVPPVILGHEMAGQIADVGSAVSTVMVGERVTALPFVHTCGHCRHCEQGFYGQCDQRRAFGVHVHGAFAPYLAVPARIVRRLPESLSYEGGALVEPLACCVKAVLETATIRAGDVVLVIGPGPIGLLAMQLAHIQGATTILVGTPRDVQRLELGRTLGADCALEGETDQVDAVLQELTHGDGADVVIECAGAPAATRSGLAWLRRRGQYLQMGLHGKPFELDFEQFAHKDARVLGSVASSASSWRRALNLLGREQVQLTPLVSAVLPLTDWERAFGMARNKEGAKILLRP